jgi:hypothetical protein
MKPSPVRQARRISSLRWLQCVCTAFVFFASCCAKDSPLIAIVLFDTQNGPSYLQVSGLTLNGKIELRACSGIASFDKRAYDSMPRVQLKAGSTLERLPDGVLMLSSEGAEPVCVVPNGVKFDKNAELTPAQAADQAQLVLLVQTSPPTTELPALKPSVRIVFVAAPDPELAEYLRAQRAQSMDLWQEYLKRYPAAAHTVQARQTLAGILGKSAESALAEYVKTARSQTPQLGLLKQARHLASQIEAVTGNHAAAQKLLQQIHGLVDALLEVNQRELQSYTRAETEHTSGYSHLVAARNQDEQILNIEPEYAPAVALHNEIGSEETRLDTSLHNAETMLLAKRYDDAFRTIGPWRGMAGELPRVATITDAVYQFHVSRGQQLGVQGTWEQAAIEYRSALAVRPESPDAAAMFKNAEAQAAEAVNRHLVEQAIADSRRYAQANDPVGAYEVLASLPAAQRSQVTAQLDALKRDYVQAAARRAQKLLEIHLPIRGHADEDAVRQAYDLLQRSGTLSNDPAIKLKLDLLSDKLGAYYLDQARRYLQKPLGSGVGLGWLYLREAQRYEPGLDAVKDEMARYQTAYQLRGRLSIGVIVRDQTSRREGPGFADQLGDAIANGLESLGQPLKVIRRYTEDPNAIQPDFVLVGEVLQHRMVKNTNLETLPSRYRAGTREVKNETWLSASQAYAQAQRDLDQGQRSLADAQQRHNKKDVTAATDNLAALQKQLDDIKKQLDTLNQTRPEAILEAYNYTKKTIDLTAVVDLAFRVTDRSGNPVESTPSVRREDHKTFVVLENVKPEDTEGIKAMNTSPDEAQFFTDLELQARDSLVKSITEKASHLPEKILSQARQQSQQQDFDGAAAEYIVYLNSTPDNGSTERVEAAKYLRDHFDLAVAGAPSSATQAQAQPVSH